ncbi:FtsX-like permease family protein [Erysipelothrix enhydrae]|uniref:FtsX-like permease family protein n=1 Tax=Erysipelothrix enhydrae TaxID=2890314 RepID=UPI002B24D3EA|nr:FtsX-like permease family protein [Erysipelothrix sp. 4322-04]WRB87145.1 FtsX-like permease family protein [Erysipelothrix sp. 4322-04]
MYLKIALRNVKKSYKDYSVYFITLTFSVALFYIFGSFEQQSSILKMTSGQGQAVQALVTTMNVMSAIISVVFAFLILYANQFLIRRRQKELGLYTLLGMPKKTISKILTYETLFIGVISLLSGLILGYVGSQLTAIASARLLKANVNYHFIFSIKATIKTILSFSAIFIIVLLFNGKVVRKHKVIELFQAERVNETTENKHPIILFIIGIVLLVLAYKWALVPIHLVLFMPFIIALGSFATFIIFKALSGFMLKFMQMNLRIYFKNLNVFVFRQVASKVNTTYKMMAVVSLLLLFGIATLATGFNLNSVMDEQVKRNTPFDYTLMIPYSTSNRDRDVETFLGQQKADALVSMNIYNSEYTVEALQNIVEVGKNEQTPRLYLADLNDYNTMRELHGLPTIALKNQAVYPYGLKHNYKDYKSNTRLISLGNEVLDVIDDQNITDMSVRNGDFNDIILFMSTETLQKIQSAQTNPVTMTTIYNINADQSTVVQTSIEQKLLELGYDQNDIISVSSEELSEMLLGIELVFTFMGLYLGVVFLISSGVILALQQLSEANDNQARYRVLSKLGTDSKMINQSIFKQVALYFFIPLLLAAIHAWVGIRAVNVNLDLAGLKASSIVPTCLTCFGVMAIYLIYFSATYFGSKSIIKGN